MIGRDHIALDAGALVDQNVQRPQLPLNLAERKQYRQRVGCGCCWEAMTAESRRHDPDSDQREATPVSVLRG